MIGYKVIFSGRSLIFSTINMANLGNMFLIIFQTYPVIYNLNNAHSSSQLIFMIYDVWTTDVLNGWCETHSN